MKGTGMTGTTRPTPTTGVITARSAADQPAASGAPAPAGQPAPQTHPAPRTRPGPTASRTARRPSPVRDAVTTGIFLALYIILFFVSGMTMGAVPLVMVALPMIFGAFGGLIFMVLLGKVQRAGIFLITGAVIGLLMITMAPAGIMCWMTILGGIVGELVYGWLGRRTFRGMTAGYTAFITIFALGEYIPFIWMREAYLELYAGQTTVSVVEEGLRIMTPTTMAVLLVLTAACCLLGCWWGRAMTRRQFARAGIV